MALKRQPQDLLQHLILGTLKYSCEVINRFYPSKHEWGQLQSRIMQFYARERRVAETEMRDTKWWCSHNERQIMRVWITYLCHPCCVYSILLMKFWHHRIPDNGIIFWSPSRSRRRRSM